MNMRAKFNGNVYIVKGSYKDFTDKEPLYQFNQKTEKDVNLYYFTEDKEFNAMYHGSSRFYTWRTETARRVIKESGAKILNFSKEFTK